MAFTEDSSVYLQDFGEVMTGPGGTDFLALWDQPDDLVTLTEAAGVSRSYRITYAGSSITLKRKDPILRDGVAYYVRETPRAISDGTFVEATLTKAPPP